jgi:hypothetical protein
LNQLLGSAIKVCDEVHLALRLRAINDLIDDLLDARAHILDPSGSEGADHETA